MPSGADLQVSAEQNRLFQAFADLSAVFVDSIQLAEKSTISKVSAAKESLQTAILNSISHDLRTPLVSILGAISSLEEEDAELTPEDRRDLIKVAHQDVERLNQLIANLLNMSRIEAGGMKLLKRQTEVADLIGVAIEQLGARAADHHIEIDLPETLPFTEVDFNLAVQVLVNILDNAIKFSPIDSPIDISARQINSELEVEIADRGPGIHPEDLGRIFDKFYQVKDGKNHEGTGLGLSICKGIVEAHGGRIWAENRLAGGTILKFTLPAAVEPDRSGKT